MGRFIVELIFLIYCAATAHSFDRDLRELEKSNELLPSPRDASSRLKAMIELFPNPDPDLNVVITQSVRTPFKRIEGSFHPTKQLPPGLLSLLQETVTVLPSIQALVALTFPAVITEASTVVTSTSVATSPVTTEIPTVTSGAATRLPETAESNAALTTPTPSSTTPNPTTTTPDPTTIISDSPTTTPNPTTTTPDPTTTASPTTTEARIEAIPFVTESPTAAPSTSVAPIVKLDVAQVSDKMSCRPDLQSPSWLSVPEGTCCSLENLSTMFDELLGLEASESKDCAVLSGSWCCYVPAHNRR